MTRPTLIRAVVGLVLIALSVPAIGADPHVTLLASAEVAFAALYAWPRAPRWADAGLLAIMLIAIVAHALRHELAAVPLFATLAIVALWRPRAVRAADLDDRAALDTFLLRKPGTFTHHPHVRVARLYVQQLPLGVAIERYSADLRRYASAQDASAKYHYTITVAFMLLIRAALADAPVGESFAAFLARNPMLASARCLDAFYSKEALGSARARGDFVFPDRITPKTTMNTP